MAGHLAHFERVAASPAGLKAAAVAVCVVVQEDSTPALLITQRADTLRSHAGQWALPGGRLEPGESAADAARRDGPAAYRGGAARHPAYFQAKTGCSKWATLIMFPCRATWQNW